MKLNRLATSAHRFTHGGAPAFPHTTAEQELRRSVLACMLWENSFYESGESIANRIKKLCAKVRPEKIAALAVEARTEHHLRHVSLLLCVELAKHSRGTSLTSTTLEMVIQRADELSEFLALYWQNGKVPLSKQIKKGLAAAFRKFDAYQLAKYNRDATIKLRDVLFMVHANPKDEEQALVWKQLVEGTLAPPDTWEVALSSGKDKKATFERLLQEATLGYLALLRNLRTMSEVGVSDALIAEAILSRRNGADRVLPFRFVAAARAAPRYESLLDQALMENIKRLPKLSGRTVVLVDVSGSMDRPLSDRSDITRMDAAATLASVLNCEHLRVFSFSRALVEVPARRGMAGVDAIVKSQRHSNTELASAVSYINERVECDRLIVITDEQATDRRTPAPRAEKAYMINVATYANGVGYGKWTHIDGFSESIIRWIHATEQGAVAQ